LIFQKKEWNKYHELYKDTVNCVPTRNIEVCTTDRVLPEPYIEKTPFPTNVKEYSMITSVISKSTKKAIEPDEPIIVKPAVAIAKDLDSSSDSITGSKGRRRNLRSGRSRVESASHYILLRKYK
jgi:hypothetical protein